jgi:hypothetical protein
MKRLLALTLFIELFVATYSAHASGSHEFCIVRVSSASQERFHARYDYGDIDPNKEVVRVLLSQKFKRASDTSVTVTDYDPAYCPGETKAVTTNASIEQIKNLGEKVAAGDVVGASVAATEIQIGVTVEQVKVTVSTTKKIVDGVVNFVKCPFC